MTINILQLNIGNRVDLQQCYRLWNEVIMPARVVDLILFTGTYIELMEYVCLLRVKINMVIKIACETSNS